jgi:DNA-binding NarL/FixJ family response regulator
VNNLPSGPLRILIADDQALVRAGFRMILEAQDGMRVVAEAEDGEQAVAAVRARRPEVALMDIRMPRLDGLEATRRIAATDATCRVLILTTFDLDEYVYAALRAGASGFLLKDVSPERLVAAVRMVAAGDALLAPSITRRLVERFARPGRSTQPGAPLVETAELGENLHVSEATVKTHVARLLSKLNLRDRVQAVVLAYETGLVRPGGESADPSSS